MSGDSMFAIGLLVGIAVCLIILLIVFYTGGGDPS